MIRDVESVHAEILKQFKKFRLLERIDSHAEQMAWAGAVRGAELRDRPVSDVTYGASQVMFEVILGPEGQGEAGRRHVPEIINMPVKVFPFPQMAF